MFYSPIHIFFLSCRPGKQIIFRSKGYLIRLQLLVPSIGHLVCVSSVSW